jgi:hypothetical protein
VMATTQTINVGGRQVSLDFKQVCIHIAYACWALLCVVAAGFATWLLFGFILADKPRCLTSWDAQYQPRYEDFSCSILINGVRVPAYKITFAPEQIQ